MTKKMFLFIQNEYLKNGRNDSQRLAPKERLVVRIDLKEPSSQFKLLQCTPPEFPEIQVGTQGLPVHMSPFCLHSPKCVHQAAKNCCDIPQGEECEMFDSSGQPSAN